MYPSHAGARACLLALLARLLAVAFFFFLFPERPRGVTVSYKYLTYPILRPPSLPNTRFPAIHIRCWKPFFFLLKKSLALALALAHTHSIRSRNPLFLLNVLGFLISKFLPSPTYLP